ncbi:protein kinase [Bermanella marisrubri]|uniref:Serine/threonine protein kinase n=1 Tax=Bermanella marisrubri TaxID=207949 RepID=Q1N0F5_9GAMM|nr:bifunctional protein-serine/threonine kinase/phosphatase [Bermanella marisrubri]EAT11709.1 Serine/threonine protein kinase [Oceanobacter sp. RED65] [Bermanella marisrubri]QIZ83256.1 protein kinase [Bermanella marisrubri]
MKHLISSIAITAGQISSQGKKDENQDCIGLCIPNEPSLSLKGVAAIVADGVSASAAAKEASETSVRTFISDYYATPEAWSVKKSGQRVLSALNRWLVGQGTIQGHLTTFSAVIFKSKKAFIFHVGDTRIYRLRGSDFECLTQDHETVVGDKQRYLYRAMGMSQSLDMDYREEALHQGDIFFLSSDGIHDYIDEQSIRAQLIGHRHHDKESIQDLTEILVKQALSAGSHDNLSCQIIRVDQLSLDNADPFYDSLTELPFPPPLSVGDRIDGYEVDSIIHESQRSQVYKVCDCENQQYYILKTPSLNYLDDPAYIERFSTEQWIGKRIENPYVVKTLTPTKPPSALYTLMEYIDGVRLDKWMMHHPKAEPQEVVRIAELLSRAIRAFHRKDILHQDIKPENIIIQADGIPKIIDFGACYVAGINEIDTPYSREQALGTADYSAPETRFGDNKSFASDQFSLAVVIYEMLTAKLPFDGKLANINHERKVSSLQYESACLHNPLVPPWMDKAIEKALSPQASQRYESLSEFIYDLKKPNPKLVARGQQPLIHRYPILLWKCISAIQAVIILGLLYFFLG